MRIRIIKFKECFEEMWQNYRFFIIFLICAFLFDTLSTIHFMRIEGILFEIHPLVRHSALLLGPIAGTILSAFIYKTVTSIFLAMYLQQLRLPILIVPAILSTFAGFYNLLTT